MKSTKDHLTECGFIHDIKAFYEAKRNQFIEEFKTVIVYLRQEKPIFVSIE